VFLGEDRANLPVEVDPVRFRSIQQTTVAAKNARHSEVNQFLPMGHICREKLHIKFTPELQRQRGESAAIPIAVAVPVFFVLVTPPPILPLLVWFDALKIPIFPMLLLEIFVPGAIFRPVPFVIIFGVPVVIPVIAVVGSQ
jgi:hypothetical protein